MEPENMNPEDIFHKAIEIADPTEQAEFLNRACKGDDQLRAEVEELLEAHEEAGDFLKAPTVEADATLDTPPMVEGPGTRIGRYELLDLTGEGGMGLVYIAEQKRPVKRRVALKIIKPGMDSKQVVARFEAERQALALLDHPNIAHVFDAGTTRGGRPYFVMEYVKGMTITKYCDERKLSIEERLQLFRDVCEGLHHAHQKGIIHRDIKPSNILVSVHGERAVPKIIDFGIAKATAQSLSDKTIFTYQGQLLGTPEYMSPEQVDLATQDIDTRSDIYSLGVVLYELLAGVLPFESDSLRQAGFAEVQKTIREQEATPPSTRLSSLGEEAKEIAKSRRTQVVTLARCLHRELEWIPLKAMRKDRARRYRSASELADDIQNYLVGAPLIAGPETTGYRVKKFVRKHAGSVATVALVAVAIILGLVVSTAMYFKAEEAHQKEIIARTEAEDARADAEDARAREVAARILAEKAKEQEASSRVRAEEAEKVAEEQRALAEEKAESYRRLSYNYGIALADARYREANMGSVQKLLDECPKDLRGWEWNRLNCISDQSLMTLHGHTWMVMTVTFSPDGRWIASGSYDTTIRIWDAATGAEVKVIRGHSDYINSIAFSSDGKWIVSGAADKTVRLWDVASGQEMMILRGHDSEVSSVAFSPDSKHIISGSLDKTVRVWDVESGKELMILHGHDDEIHSIAISPDGQSIASVSWDKNIILWNAMTGEQLKTLRGQGPLFCVAFSPDSKHVICAGVKGIIRVFDTSSGNMLQVLQGHNGRINYVAFSSDGKRIVSSDSKNTIRIWDTKTGEELRVLRGHEKGVFCASFSPDGSQLVSCGGDSIIKVWDAYIDHAQLSLYGHKDYITGLVFTPNGKQIVSGSWDGTVKIWDTASGAEMLTFYTHEGDLTSIAISPDGKLIASAGFYDKTIKLWKLKTGEELMTIRGHEAEVQTVAFSPDGNRIVSGSFDMTVRVWDVATGNELMTLRGHNSAVHRVAFSPDGKKIVSGGANWTIKIWDASTGNELRTLYGHEGNVRHVAFSKDGKYIVSSGKDNTVKVWDAMTGNELITLEGHNDKVLSAVLSHDSQRVISASMDGTIRVWDLKSGQELAVMSSGTGYYSCAISPDGQTFAAGSIDGEIILWQSSISPEWRSLRQITGKARVVVDEFYAKHGLYHAVIERLNSDTNFEASVRHVALQIANARRSEDIKKLKEESWEAISSSNKKIDEYQVALEKARKANNLEPNNWSVVNTLGVAQYRVGAYRDAIETLAKAESIREDSGAKSDPANMACMAMALERLGRSEDALLFLDRLRSLFEKEQLDNDFRAQSFLIETERVFAGDNPKLSAIWEHIRVGKVDDAVQVMEETHSLRDPELEVKMKGAVKWLGRAYYRQGRRILNINSAEKIANYEKAVNIDPNHAAALNDLAWLRATCPVDELRSGDQAVVLAKRAAEITEWKNHEYISTLAAAYSATGDFDAARKWQNKAMDLLPKNCPPELRVNYNIRLKVYGSHKSYHKGTLWSLSDGELVVHWKFDEVEGREAFDSTKNSLHGVLVGDAHIVSDPERGRVLSFYGKGGSVECAYNPALNITGAFTVATWMKTKTSNASWLSIGCDTWWLFGNNDNHINFGGTFTEGAIFGFRWINTKGNMDVSDGKWHHVVGVHDGIKVYTYVDGILDSYQDFGGKMATYNTGFAIEASLPSEDELNGLIDDVRIYSYALIPEEVKMLYEGKEPPHEKTSQ